MTKSQNNKPAVPLIIKNDLNSKVKSAEKTGDKQTHDNDSKMETPSNSNFVTNVFSDTFFEVIKTEPLITRTAYEGKPDGINPVREPEPENPLKKFAKVGKDKMVNRETGEVFDVRIPEYKGESLASVYRSFNRIRRILFTDICASSPEKNKVAATVATLTMNRCSDLNIFKRLTKNYVNKVSYKYRGVKYYYFIERSLFSCRSGNERYHIHIFFWFEKSPVALSKEFRDYIQNSWEHGVFKCADSITTEEKLSRAVYYVTNYTNTNETTSCKQETLKYFPSGTHLHGGSRNIRKKLSSHPGVPEGISQDLSDADITSSKQFGGNKYRHGTYILNEEKDNPEGFLDAFSIDLIDNLIEKIERGESTDKYYKF